MQLTEPALINDSCMSLQLIINRTHDDVHCFDLRSSIDAASECCVHSVTLKKQTCSRLPAKHQNPTFPRKLMYNYQASICIAITGTITTAAAHPLSF